MLRNRFRLFHPTTGCTFERLQVVDVVSEAAENELAMAKAFPVRADNTLLLDLVLILHAHRRDLLFQEVMDRFLDGILRLADAHHALVLPGSQYQERSGELPGFQAASPAVHDLVTVRFE